MADQLDVVRLWQDSQDVLNLLKRIHDAIKSEWDWECELPNLYEEASQSGSCPHLVAEPTFELVTVLEGPQFNSWFRLRESDRYHSIEPVSAKRLLDHTFSCVLPYVRDLTTQLGMDRFGGGPGGLQYATHEAQRAVDGLQRQIVELEECQMLAVWLYQASKEKLRLRAPPHGEGDIDEDDPFAQPPELNGDHPPLEPLSTAYRDVPAADGSDDIPQDPESPACGDNAVDGEDHEKWWHKLAEPRPAEYKFGPITGMKKDICRWMKEKPTPNPRRLAQQAKIHIVWVIRLAGNKWEVWFKDEREFQLVDSERRYGLKDG